MPSSRASWRIRKCPRATPLDKEEPRMPIPRNTVNKGKKKGRDCYTPAPCCRLNDGGFWGISDSLSRHSGE
jgi:hypothetical protein